MYGPKDIPSVGKLEFSWVNTPLTPISIPSKHDGAATNAMDTGGSNVTDGENGRDLGGHHGQIEVDYDVAEDDDRWMVQ